MWSLELYNVPGLIHLFIGQETSHSPDLIYKEPQMIGLFDQESRPLYDADGSIVGRYGRFFISLVGTYKLGGGYVECGRDVPNLIGDGGFGGSLEAAAADAEGYDKPRNDKEGCGQG